jgi:hypothetical protein
MLHRNSGDIVETCCIHFGRSIITTGRGLEDVADNKENNHYCEKHLHTQVCIQVPAMFLQR